MRISLSMIFVTLASLPAWAQQSSLEPFIERYAADEGDLRRFYSITLSPQRTERLQSFWQAQLEELQRLAFSDLAPVAQRDYVLLRTHIEGRIAAEGHRLRRLEEIRPWLPFATEIIALEEARWLLKPLDLPQTAQRLEDLHLAIDQARESLKKSSESEEASSISSSAALRAAAEIDNLRSALANWYDHYATYVPEFSWWMEKPSNEVRQGLRDLAGYLRRDVAGQKGQEGDPLVGEPIGRAALLDDLAAEMLPYTPEELLQIGEREFAWCEQQAQQVVKDLKLEDWAAVLDYVKTLHVPPGEHDLLVAEQARHAIQFLDQRQLVTIPQICRDTWRLEMLSAGSQRTLPYGAYGGQKMLVAFPTDAMDHSQKVMSMRGNNIHFSRIVTPHELIPGHHLQGFMGRRYKTYRRPFSTPFLGEGWCLYWEMLLWDLQYPLSPENRAGMLFWRMHRCARIVVSLKYHLNQMEPTEMIEFLIDRVGHERDGATSEVRRYIGGAYGPLYQCGYMIGGLQLMALRRELVDTGRMSDREFHDAILQENSIPIEMIRASLTEQVLTPTHRASWKFADPPHSQ